MSEIINIEERQRIKRILDGKREEYAWFVNTYSQQVFNFTSRMLPYAEDAQEVAQDAFVKAFRSLDTFQYQSSFCTWVCRIAYRESLNRLNRQQPHYVDIVNLPAIEDDEEELSTGREERVEQLMQMVDDLPADERMLLTLYYFEDRPLTEIAYIMGVEAGVLANRLYRMRKKLYKKLKDEERTI